MTPMLVPFDSDVSAVLADVGRAAETVGVQAWAVGGVVRDALVGRSSRDVDISAAGDVNALTALLVEKWGAKSEHHGCFGTATLKRPDGFTVDIALTRTETYPYPGALPEVRPAGLSADLKRRDFTVNAMAAALTGPAFGSLIDIHNGLRDLRAGVLRVMHERSFLDDPTRLFRAARYAVRFNLTPDSETKKLAGSAVSEGALGTISADRRRREVELLLAEPDWANAVAWLNTWGVWSALAGGWEPSAGLLKRADVTHAWAVRSLPEAVPEVSRLRYLLLLSAAPGKLLSALGATPADRRLSERVPVVLESMGEPESPGWWRAMDDESMEVLLVCLAQSRGDSEKGRLAKYLESVRSLRPSITGGDLLSLGAIPGPELGSALEAVLDAVREHRVKGRDAELDYAQMQLRKK